MCVYGSEEEMLNIPQSTCACVCTCAQALWISLPSVCRQLFKRTLSIRGKIAFDFHLTHCSVDTVTSAAGSVPSERAPFVAAISAGRDNTVDRIKTIISGLHISLASLQPVNLHSRTAFSSLLHIM